MSKDQHSQTATQDSPDAAPVKGVKVKMRTAFAGERWAANPGEVLLMPNARLADLFIAKDIAEPCSQAVPHDKAFIEPMTRERR